MTSHALAPANRNHRGIEILSFSRAMLTVTNHNIKQSFTALYHSVKKCYIAMPSHKTLPGGMTFFGTDVFTHLYYGFSMPEIYTP